MDLKYLPQGRFQLTLVDDCSRMLAAAVLTRRTTSAVCRALPARLAALPFPLRCLQTDNGSEFGQELTGLLARQGIRHAHIRPRSPHLERQGGAGAADGAGGTVGRGAARANEAAAAAGLRALL